MYETDIRYVVTCISPKKKTNLFKRKRTLNL